MNLQERIDKLEKKGALRKLSDSSSSGGQNNFYFFLITVWFWISLKLNSDESSSESDSDSEDTKRNTPIEKVFAKSLTFLNIAQLSDNEKSTLLKMTEQVINVHSGSFCIISGD